MYFTHYNLQVESKKQTIELSHQSKKLTMSKLGTDNNPLMLRVQTQKRVEEVMDICQELGVEFILDLDPDEPEDISALKRLFNPPQPIVKSRHISRNDPCYCGSGKKYKKCCLGKDQAKHSQPETDTPRCALCGSTTNLIRTECCGQWICDDEKNYELFSYARNSCHRNHRRYTLCGIHHASVATTEQITQWVVR
jgi:SWIM/SEC-C metal-binding protein